MPIRRLTLMLLAAGLTAALGARADEAQLLQEARGIPAKMVPKLFEVLQDLVHASLAARYPVFFVFWVTLAS